MHITSPYYRAIFTFSDGAQTASFSTYYAENGDSNPDPTELQGLVEVIGGTFIGSLQAVLSEDTFVASIVLQYRAGDVVREASAVGSLPAEGSNESENMPLDCAVCIGRRSDDTKRNRNGRVYVPFIPEVLQKDGVLTGPGAVAYGTVAENILIAINDDAIFLYPVTPNHKEGLAWPIVKTHVNRVVCSRMDRRKRNLLRAAAGVLDNPYVP